MLVLRVRLCIFSSDNTLVQVERDGLSENYAANPRHSRGGLRSRKDRNWRARCSDFMGNIRLGEQKQVKNDLHIND